MATPHGQQYEALRVFYRQQPEHYLIEQTEDRGVCANAKGERENCHNREKGRAAESAQCVAYIVREIDHGESRGLNRSD
jgi:hypothetical protein